MKKLIPLLILYTLFPITGFAQKYSVSGTVYVKGSDKRVDMAVVLLPKSDLWAVADANGDFTIKNVPKGANEIEVSCLGYATSSITVDIERDVKGLKLFLAEDNLVLESVVITAKEKSNDATTSRTIDRTAMDHMQMLNVADVMRLLPGGSTVNNNSDMASSVANRFSLRAGGDSEMGNPTFGTAVEVDGIRLSTNSNFSSIRGAVTKNIASSNIESVEVITGVPSVEYGDMTNGIVKFNIKKGKSPYTITISTNPRQKQYSITKGFDLSGQSGVINISAERTEAFSSICSPFTTYVRNAASLTYSNNSKIGDVPLRFSVGVSGNTGGYDQKADPDLSVGTFTKQQDNSVRGNFSLNLLFNKAWITGMELTGSISYADNLYSIRSRKSSSSSTSAIHGTEKGYFVSMTYEENPNAEVLIIPAGYWYELMYEDSRPLDYNIHLKANLSKRLGEINSKTKVGATFTSNGNLGRGTYYDDMRYAPTWREWRYDQIPFMNNLALYAEENLTIPIGSTSLDLIAGVRSETTMIENSGYGVVNSLSPRFNAKYTIVENDRTSVLHTLKVRASWGLATKLPSFSVLYPKPTYTNTRTFAPGTLSDGTAFYAYHIYPRTLQYNSQLRWSSNEASELGVEATIGGVMISLVGYYNKSKDPYTQISEYERFSYNYTDQFNLESCTIPESDRRFIVDRQTGIVTVVDKTGTLPNEVLSYTTKEVYTPVSKMINGASSVRKGLEMVVDFGQIRPLRTSVRLDGSYYYYKGISTIIEQDSPHTTTMSDGRFYRYVGYYVGGSSYYNGSVSRKMNANLTLTTHIPRIRTIISLRIEACLYDYSQKLSEGVNGARRSYVLGNNSPYIPDDFDADIYAGSNYTLTYPDYYTTYENPDEKIPFREKFLWAKDNDTALYNSLAQLVVKSGGANWLLPLTYSTRWSANISVTKEIGDLASVSFYANNFTNTMATYRNYRDNTESSLFGQTLFVPRFYYGITLKIKF